MFKRILSKYLLFWLILFCLLGTSWKMIFGPDAFDPFALNGNQMAALISITMLAVGSLLPFDEVVGVAKNWPKVVGGTFVQYVSMPLLAFCVAKIFNLQGGDFVGIMIAGCVPGAMASNVLTLTARGNVSYSVGLTTSATLLSPLVVPATLWFFFKEKSFNIDFIKMMQNLLLTVVVPVVAGFTLSRLFKWWQKCSEMFAEIIANIVIIWIITSVVASNSGKIVELTAAPLCAIVILNVMGYLAGFFGGTALGITPAMRRALTIEVGMQNAGLGTTLAKIYFEDLPDAALMCAVYTFECMATGVILAQFFRFVTERAEKKSAQTVSAATDEGKELSLKKSE